MEEEEVPAPKACENNNGVTEIWVEKKMSDK
jgi:hypothetical protein